MGYCLNGVNTGGVPLYIIKEFLNDIDIPVFIETGTAGGGSILEASKLFKECYTIEIDESRKIPVPKNVIQLYGNSSDVLPKILDDLIESKGDVHENYRYALFWLDSHFDGDKPEDSPYKDCYLLEELEIISRYSADSIIFIDDARLFMGYPPHPNNPKQWPTVAEIFSKFKEKFPYHFTTIVDDYIISFPDRLEWIYQREWMARYKIRYPDEPEVIRNAARLAYNSFIKYIQ